MAEPIAYPNGIHNLTIGGTMSNPAHIHGNFDELRVSLGVLPVDKFMRIFPTSTLFLVR